MNFVSTLHCEGRIGTYTPTFMDLADHFRTIAANWWRILLIAAIVGGGVYGWSRHQPNTYVAAYLVNVAPEVDKGIGIDPNTLAIRVANETFTLQSQAVAVQAVKTGKLRINADELRSRLEVVTVSFAGNILIKTSAHSTTEALAEADAYAKALQQSSIDTAQSEVDALIQQIKDSITAYTAYAKQPAVKGTPAEQEIKNRIEEQTKAQFTLEHPFSVSLGVIRLKGTATLDNNGEPVAPSPIRDGVLALLIAFVVASEGFVLVHAFSDRVSKATDVEAITELTGLPVLALVPRGRGPEVVEAFRTLRTNLMFLEGSGRPRTIAVLSPNPAAGKSFCAMHLAESAVAVDAQVVLVDADLRRPVLHLRLRTDREPGLSDALRGMPLAQTLHRVDGHSNLQLMPSGSPVADTVAALGGREFRQVLDSLDTAELVIVDTPPGAGYADALAVAAQCDAALLVLDSETTRKRTTKQFIEALDRTGASIIGVVLNGATVNKRDTYER